MKKERLSLETEGKYVLYEIFHENTKMDLRNAYEEMKRIGMVKSNKALLEKMAFSFKIYPYKKSVQLTEDFPRNRMSVEQAILTRRSRRKLTKEKLSLTEISEILYFSYGITNKAPLVTDPDKYQFLRSAPSAGALFPLEIYPLILNAEIPHGLYHYNIKDFKLELLKEGDFTSLLPKFFQGMIGIENASMVLLLSAIFQRSTIKYGNRGYRFVFLDAGHLMENAYLITNAMELGCYTIGGFADRMVEDFIGLDGVNESVIYAAAIGTISHEGEDEVKH